MTTDARKRPSLAANTREAPGPAPGAATGAATNITPGATTGANTGVSVGWARFAPSPSGFLHVGHAYAAEVAWTLGAPCLIRVEDLDPGRCRPAFETALLEDLAWLGYESAAPILRQSSRLDAYREALQQLRADGLVYACFCSRADISRRLAAARRPAAEMGGKARLTVNPELEDGALQAPQAGRSTPQGAGRAGEGPQAKALLSDQLRAPYDGFCRHLTDRDRAGRIDAGRPFLWRLDARACLARVGGATLGFDDVLLGRIEYATESLGRVLGDVAITRRDIDASYHLAVVLDDAFQGVTLAPRGEDLAPITFYHRLLQAALGLAPPRYAHHPLVVDQHGQRMSKRFASREVRELRRQNWSPDAVHALARRQLAAHSPVREALAAGLEQTATPLTP